LRSYDQLEHSPNFYPALVVCPPFFAEQINKRK
jgi:hypothetical protein